MGDRGYPAPLPLPCPTGLFWVLVQRYMFVCLYVSLYLSYRDFVGLVQRYMFVSLYLFVCICPTGLFCIWFRDICLCVCVFVYICPTRISAHISEQNQNNPVRQPA